MSVKCIEKLTSLQCAENLLRIVDFVFSVVVLEFNKNPFRTNFFAKSFLRKWTIVWVYDIDPKLLNTCNKYTKNNMKVVLSTCRGLYRRLSLCHFIPLRTKNIFCRHFYFIFFLFIYLPKYQVSPFLNVCTCSHAVLT